MPRYDLSLEEMEIIVSWLHEPHGYLEDLPDDTETRMVVWIRDNDGVEIVRPGEVGTWIPILEGWESSISAGFARASIVDRNKSTVPMFDSSSVEMVPMKSGDQLDHQQQIISKVLAVLQ